MGTSTRRSRNLGRPKFYEEERIGDISFRNTGRQPELWRGFPERGSTFPGGWVGFTPPGESTEVQLKVSAGGDPYEAMREWFVRREAGKRKRPKMLDVRALLPIWNYGSSSRWPRAETDKDGYLRFEPEWSPPWDHMNRAQQVWHENGGQGRHPVDVLAALDPDSYVPFLSAPRPHRIPPKNRWVSVSIDLARPLADQFKEAKRICRLAKEYARLLAGQPAERPGRRELRRNVLIYTLKESARLTNRQIADEMFPEEKPDSAQQKVKQIVREIHRALQGGGFKPKA